MATTNTNPPPTYAEVIIKQGEGWVFNPIWLRWFIDWTEQVQGLPEGGGLPPNLVLTNTNTVTAPPGVPTNAVTLTPGISAMYLVAVTAEGAVDIADYSAFAVVMTAGNTAGATWVNNGKKQKIALSGMNIQVIQTGAAPLQSKVAVTQIG